MIGNSELAPIMKFVPELVLSLPETYGLLAGSNLVVHPSVSSIVLHGSRGLAGGCRPDSDIDLSLIVDSQYGLPPESELKEVIETTLGHWQAATELDLAVIFDRKHCTLRCFEQRTWQQDLCELGGVDCFGLYKTQKGFNGLVTNAGIQVRLMYPCLKIWQREMSNCS